jgi:hypothetical protein
MVEDALDDVRLRDEANDAHAAGAPWAGERVDLVDTPQEIGPTLACDPDGGAGRLGLIRALALGVEGLAGDGPREVTDIPSLQAALRDWAAENPEIVDQVTLILGFGYDNAQLAELRHPTRHDLDAVSAEVPILIVHQSGHLGVANSRAFELAGIDAAAGSFAR